MLSPCTVAPETAAHGKLARDSLAIALAAAVMLSAAGCIGPGNRQTMRFDLAPGPVGAEVTERHRYFFWGLLPTARGSGLEKCPFGVVAIRQTPGDGGALTWIPTLGLFSSRSTTYLCRAEAPSAP